ncbi:cyclase family protein [Dysgonomonas sp. BGC7]|uniref:cyclase family protein n=1 Tax=Dysgonomonas sp. BGC7 TaxID=1658008 RepID=UPI000680B81E|nr:cyclase family protein [Dysgonomonas sp. BGC7]MBD8387442.1 cyclase family protein [Dysgonomonas sp. BGC7]
MNLHIELDSSHPAYEWLEKQADKIGAKGHFGTHIDCYTSSPSENKYNLPIYLMNCINGMSSAETIQSLSQLNGQALILYTGNLHRNGYGTQEYFGADTTLSREALTLILEKKPSFILIDSYGIGHHGENHQSLDKQCEASGCYVIENICIAPEEVQKIQRINIEFDLDYPSSGKPCKVTY